MVLILFLIPAATQAQDTVNFVRYYDGTKTFELRTKKDTVLISTYPNGKKESGRTVKKFQISGTYKRWYNNGKIMWEREIVKNQAHGITKYYSDKGVKVAELKFENGVITDTVFMMKNIRLVLGKITSSSTVYGGAVNEDGTSNVSSYSGPYMYCAMYAAKVDSLKKPVLVQHFRSDHNGEFFIIAPVGKISFFPKSIPIEKLNVGEFYPPTIMNRSGHDGWTVTPCPLHIKTNSILSVVLIQFVSVGYAP
jgi:hypothetical protein